MNEQLLHFIWKFGLFDKQNLTSTDGTALEIVHPGWHNKDSGPDFQEAKVRYDDNLWVGCVELHIDGKDWNRHLHHRDKAYNNVILHVVYGSGFENTRNEKGESLPVLDLKQRIRHDLLSRYHQLREHQDWIPCERFFNQVDSFVLGNMLDRLAVERLEGKVNQIQTMLEASKNDWEQVTYEMIARYLGASVNKEPFMRLAHSLPIRIWAKHRDDLIQLEALVFGQAGFLEKPTNDEYPNRLRKEYLYLKRLYQLSPMEQHSWKFLRLRPANFPTIRLAQLAALMNKEAKLFSQILDAKNATEIKQIFELEVSDYWTTHYVFDKVSKTQQHPLGNSMKNILLINAVAPVLFSYGKYKDNEAACEKALQLLEICKPEENSIIKQWKKLGCSPSNAFDTQALLQLKNEYCGRFRCLECSVGARILK